MLAWVDSDQNQWKTTAVETKNQVKKWNPWQTTEKDLAGISGFGQACPPQTGLPASFVIPRASGSGVGWEKNTVVLSRVTGQSQGQIKAKWIAKILPHFGTSYERWRNGSTGLSAHRDGNPPPQISQERACRPPLPLPRIWQGQAHVPTWYVLFFLPSARKHKHHERPSFLNSPEWLHRVVSERGLRAHTHCLHALIQPVYR